MNKLVKLHMILRCYMACNSCDSGCDTIKVYKGFSELIPAI